jgi:hypothetical protein
MPIPMFDHPVRTFDVSFPASACAFRLSIRVTVENDARDVVPIGSFRFSIKETRIGDEMPLVIRRDDIGIGNIVSDIGIEDRFWHGKLL